MKIHLVKQLNGSFLPAYASDHDKAKKIKAGAMVDCDIKQPRNLAFHKKFFILMNIVFDNQPEDCSINNIEHLRKYLTKRSGFYHAIDTPTGTIYEAKSISFAKMSQEDFDSFYNCFIDTVVKIYQWRKDDLTESVNDMMKSIEDFY